MLKDVGRWLYWTLWAGLKLVLAFIGLVTVPFTDKINNPVWGNRERQYLGRWEDYKWRAIRNPVNNMRYWRVFEEPQWYVDKNVVGSPDPDIEVRNYGKSAAQRTIRVGKYIEHWKVWRHEDGDIAEFRIGWKFGRVPGFAPTLQFRKGD